MRFMALLLIAFLATTVQAGNILDRAVKKHFCSAEAKSEPTVEKTINVQVETQKEWHEGYWWKRMPVWNWRQKRFEKKWHYYVSSIGEDGRGVWLQYDPDRPPGKDQTTLYIGPYQYQKVETYTPESTKYEMQYQPMMYQMRYQPMMYQPRRMFGGAACST